MEVNSLTINKVFSSGGDVQYFLPHFQREYAWERSNWQTLLDDIIGIYEFQTKNPDSEPEHFLGAMVVIADGTRSGTMPVFKLVDGQQRLTTIALFLCALGHLVREDANLNRKIQRMLINPDEEDDLRFKIVPTLKYGDRSAYMAILTGDDVPNVESRIIYAYEYFYKQLRAKINGSGIDPERLYIVVVNYMHVVFINLNQRERPYEIFESLNAKGKPLTQPDLVRNYIAMRLPESMQGEVFEKYWVRIEDMLRESRTVSRTGELTAFLRHYLAFRSGVLPNQDHVYARFRDRIERQFSSTEEFREEIVALHRFAEYYNQFLRPKQVADRGIRVALERLNTLEIFTAYPFMMAAFDNYHQGLIDRSELLESLSVLENYMVRRFLAGEQTAYVNKMFPTLEREVSRSRFAESLKQALITKNYPSDNRIRQALKTQPIYDKRRPRRLILILDTINRYLSQGSGGHTVLDGEATIEHIMPQSLDDGWKRHIGSNWDEVYRETLHTLGNLTIVTQEWNSSLSNSPFLKKKQKLAQHALLINRQHFDQEIDTWNAEAIQKRADAITEHILQIWPAFGEPPITEDVSGRKPRALIVIGESYQVSSWRDVAVQMAETMAHLADNFDEIAEEMTSFFARDERPRSRKLSNGWWLYINLSSNSVVNFCEHISSMVGLTDDDWEIELL